MRRLHVALPLVAALVLVGVALVLRERAPDPLGVDPRRAQPGPAEAGASAPRPEVERAVASVGSERRVTPARSPEEAAKPDSSSAPSIRLEGEVVQRGTLRPVARGRITFEAVEPDDDPRALATLPTQALDERVNADWTVELDGAGGFALELPADAHLFRARVEPSPVRHFGELGEQSRVLDEGFVPTTEELRRRVSEIGAWLRIEVDPGISVHGRVVDALDGTGVDGALVVTKPLPHNRVGTRTDAHGEFRLTGISEDHARWFPNGVLELEAHHPAYVIGATRVELDDAGGSPRRVEIRLGRGVTIAGRVVDADGGGVPGAMVEARVVSHAGVGLGSALALHELTRADNEGAFRFHALPPTPALAVTVTGWHAGGETLVLDASRSHEDVELRLAQRCVFELRAEDPDGAPVAAERLVVLLRAEGAATRVVYPRFEAPCGRALELDVFAPPRDGAPEGETLRGRALVPPTEATAQPFPVAVRLERFVGGTPATPQQGYGIALNAPEHARRTYDLVLLDAVTGSPLPDGARVRFECDRSSGSGTLGPGGAVRLSLGIGPRVVTVASEGYRPLVLHTEEPEPGYRGSVELRLERGEDR